MPSRRLPMLANHLLMCSGCSAALSEGLRFYCYGEARARDRVILPSTAAGAGVAEDARRLRALAPAAVAGEPSSCICRKRGGRAGGAVGTAARAAAGCAAGAIGGAVGGATRGASADTAAGEGPDGASGSCWLASVPAAFRMTSSRSSCLHESSVPAATPRRASTRRRSSSNVIVGADAAGPASAVASRYTSETACSSAVWPRERPAASRFSFDAVVSLHSNSKDGDSFETSNWQRVSTPTRPKKLC